MRTKIAIGVLALAASGFADIIDKNATLSAGAGFAFDTGSTSASGDIVFTGTSITWQGGAKGGVIPGATGATAYSAITPQVLTGLASFASNSPIPASSLAVGTVVGLQTKGGNGAKFLVTAISSTSLSFEYTTYGGNAGGGGGSSTPNISKVLNNSSLIPTGFSNSGVTPSSIIQIQGSNLSDPVQGTLALEDSTKGLPTTLRGASAKVTAGGKDYPIAWYYTSPSQSAGVLPAGVPPGQATLTYTYNGTTTTSSINVVPAAFGIDVYNGNYAVLQDSVSGAIISPTNSAKPGETLTLWGSGLGADQGLSDTTANAAQQKINTPIQVFIGSTQVPQSNIRYVGSLYYPGVNGIVFDVPQGVASGCFLSIAVVAKVNNNSVTSNVATASFMPNGGVCQDVYTGLDGNSVSTLNSGGNTRSGFVSIFQSSNQAPGGSTTVTDSAFASFNQTSGVSAFNDSSSTTSVGSCTLIQTLSNSSGGPLPTVTGLNAGTITVTPPSGGTINLTSFPQVPGTYTASLTSAIPSAGGTYTITGSGGSGANAVGPFTTTITFGGPLLSWTNQASNATVIRSQGQTYTWTGGTPNTFVIMTGSSTSTSSGVTASYFCIAPVEAQTFTVPAYITAGLPQGSGSSSIENSTAFNLFKATGLDFGAAIGAVSFQINSTFN